MTEPLRNDPAPLMRAEIDLDTLRRNMREIKNLAGGVPIMAAVKADAYGHGVEHVAPVLQNEGISAFGVATPEEGVELRGLGITGKILVFGELAPRFLPEYVRSELDASVGSEHAVDAVLDFDQSLRVHVKVDTGMHRLGLQPSQVSNAIARLQQASHVSIDGLWTHLASADEPDLAFAKKQIAVFDEVRKSLGDVARTVHVANSGALVQLPEAVVGRDFVRIGGLLYGLYSSETLEPLVRVNPVMRLVSQVVHINPVGPGETVSYGGTWRAEKSTLIATVSAGYGDGLPRALSNRGQVAIGGHRFRIAGRVCMDMLMVDLGPPDGPGADVAVGDEVVLFGGDGPTTLEVANWAETLSYELTAGLTRRVLRQAA